MQYLCGQKGAYIESGKNIRRVRRGYKRSAALLASTGIGIPEGAAEEIVGTIVCGAVTVGGVFAVDRLCDFTAQKISALVGCHGDCSQCPRPCLGFVCGAGETCVDGCCIGNPPCGDNPPCPAGFCPFRIGLCLNGCCVTCGGLERCPFGFCTDEHAICRNGCCFVPSSTTTTSTTTSSCSTSLPATITCPSGSPQPTVVPCPCCFQNLCSQHPIQCGCLCGCSS